jgi:hypothetical protein
VYGDVPPVASAVQVTNVPVNVGTPGLAVNEMTVSGSAAAEEDRGGAFSIAEGPERLRTSRTAESNVRRTGFRSPTQLRL